MIFPFFGVLEIVRFYPHPDPLPEGEGTMRQSRKVLGSASAVKEVQQPSAVNALFLLPPGEGSG